MGANITLFFFMIMATAVLSKIPTIKKCKIDDETCLKTAAQSAASLLAAGVPEFGTEPLDVMHVDLIKVDLAGLKLNIMDANVKGLKNAVIDKVTIDSKKKIVLLVFHTDITMKGHYKAAGRLLVLPISGDGDTSIKLKKIQIEMRMPYEVVKNAQGDDIIDLKSFKYNYDVKENAHFQLSNLFNGNKALSETMHRFMNENWKTLSEEFGTPMLEKPNAKIFQSIRAYLRSRPMNDIIEL